MSKLPMYGRRKAYSGYRSARGQGRSRVFRRGQVSRYRSVQFRDHNQYRARRLYNLKSILRQSGQRPVQSSGGRDSMREFATQVASELKRCYDHSGVGLMPTSDSLCGPSLVGGGPSGLSGGSSGLSLHCERPDDQSSNDASGSEVRHPVRQDLVPECSGRRPDPLREDLPKTA